MTQNTRKVSPTTSEVPAEVIERLIREQAVDEAVCFPETEEELQALERALEQKKRTKVPDVAKILERIQGTGGKAAKVIQPHPFVEENVVHEMAAAARNGKAIPDHIRSRMDADRRAKEEERARK
jgi:hypothetical protein